METLHKTNPIVKIETYSKNAGILYPETVHFVSSNVQKQTHLSIFVSHDFPPETLFFVRGRISCDTNLASLGPPAQLYNKMGLTKRFTRCLSPN